MRFKKVLMSALLCAALFTGYSFADEAEDSFEYDDPSWINNVPPTSYWGLRGLPGTVSAEGLGLGRFNMALFGSYFEQKQRIDHPKQGTNVATLRGALSWGVSEDFDIFGVLPVYFAEGGGLSGLIGGVQYSVPIPPELPVRLAGQLQFIYGMRTEGENWRLRGDNKNQTNITYNRWYVLDDDNEEGVDQDDGRDKISYAGYDHFEVRNNNHLDLIMKFSQSLVAGNSRSGVKLHLNEGFAITPRMTYEWLFLMAAGLQWDVTEYLTLGLEANLRTKLLGPTFKDPFWITPSFSVRSPYYSEGLVGMSFVGGIDIRTSAGKEVVEVTKKFNEERNEWVEITRENRTVYPLEPWRIFGDLVISLDYKASTRAEQARQARAAAAERARLKREVQHSAEQRDSIARRAREDSLRLANEMAERAQADSIRAKHVADSLAAIAAAVGEKARQDSIAAARHAAEVEQKRVADSLEFARRLAEERAKRSEMENNLLSTGMIVLGGVYFETGKAIISRNSEPYLETIAKMLAKYPKLRLEIGGHTDATGRFETNMSLSQGRADAVFMFMQRIEPALAQMLTAKGYGPTMPKEDNNTAKGREANRRVELKVLNPEVLQEYNP